MAQQVIESMVPRPVDRTVGGDDVLGLRVSGGRQYRGQAENPGEDPSFRHVQPHNVSTSVTSSVWIHSRG